MTALDHVLQAQASKVAITDGLAAHVNELIESCRTEVLRSTTSTSAAIGELARRNDGIEQAIRAIAAAVEELAARDR